MLEMAEWLGGWVTGFGKLGNRELETGTRKCNLVRGLAVWR